MHNTEEELCKEIFKRAGSFKDIRYVECGSLDWDNDDIPESVQATVDRFDIRIIRSCYRNQPYRYIVRVHSEKDNLYVASLFWYKSSNFAKQLEGVFKTIGEAKARVREELEGPADKARIRKIEECLHSIKQIPIPK